MNQNVYGVIGVCVFGALCVLVKHHLVRSAIGNLLKQFGARLVVWVNPPPQFDPLAEDLALALRQEKLRADVRRLQRILVTDESMSATRQIGNRLAYDWLVRELDQSTRRLSPLFVNEESYGNWDVSAPLVPTKARPSIRDAQRPPQVEILEIGWKRGSTSRR